ncbi:MAG: alkaline phosphatase family protein [Candidatus Firestonebacteria bacterium]|nr:alkaline phosphatase family protein [Candidatus Firestonebacteria bacterium]
MFNIFKKNNKKRTVIIGFDGAPYRLIQDLTSCGTMPRLREIIKSGTFSKIASSIPEVSSVAWSSIITGKNPGQHGIYGFMEMKKGTYQLTFPNFNDLREKPFWENLTDKKSAIINVPSTYPARYLNGILISGFVAIELEKATFPQSLIPELKENDYRLDVDIQKAHQSMDLFLKDLYETHELRIKSYRMLWEKDDWDIFMFIFTETDRLFHFLWEAYEDKSHKYHKNFIEYFQKLDEAVGEIYSNLKKDDSFIMLSDHGFELLEKEVYVNSFLVEKGFLKLKQVPANSFDDIDTGTKAFALDPARIYINMEGKYPRGSVTLDKKQEVIKNLIETFTDLKIDNKPVIKRIFRKEELYTGKYLEDAPDLVLLSNKGFDLKATIRETEIAGKRIFTGKHTQDDAFIYFNWTDDQFPKEPSVTDFISLINR